MIVPPTPANVDRAARALIEGRLVAFATETVYGLGGDARSDDAVRRVFSAKGRPADHPVIVHVADASSIDRWARTVPADAAALAAAFWPGPLTLILPRAETVSDLLNGGQDSVGLRVPSHPVARALLARFVELGGDGVAAPSANRFGRVSATTAAHVAEEFGDSLELILDGGACEHGIESTIVSFTGNAAVLLRPGAIGRDQLALVLGYDPLIPDASAPRASGLLASHYAPRTLSRLLSPSALLAGLSTIQNDDATTMATIVAVLSHSLDRPHGFRGTWIGASASSVDYAHALYANLRTLDAIGAQEIWIEAPPEDPRWMGIADRLRRATYHP